MDWIKQYEKTNDDSDSDTDNDSQIVKESINSINELPTTFNEAMNHPNKQL